MYLQNLTNPRCVFWDEAELTWSSEGCRTVSEESGDTVTTCQCDHLTNFALLMVSAAVFVLSGLSSPADCAARMNASLA